MRGSGRRRPIKRRAAGDEAEKEEDEDLSAKFEAAAARAQGVDEGAQLDPGNGGVLLSGERGEETCGCSALRGRGGL